MSGTRRTTRSASGRQLRKPTPAACGASWERGAKAPGEGGQELRRVVAGGDETRFGGAAGPDGRIGDEAAKDDRRAVDCVREHIVRGLSGRRGGVVAVLFREQEVEHDRGGPGVLQRLHQRREALAPPRPLAKPLERFIVDRDNAHGLVERVGARLPALVLVEHQILHHRARGRANDAGQQREQASGGRRQCVKSGLARFSHTVLAVSRDIRKEESPVLSSRWHLDSALRRWTGRNHSPSNAPIVRRRNLLAPGYVWRPTNSRAHGG